MNFSYLIPKTDSKEHKYKLQMKKNTVNPKWNAEVNFMDLDSAVIEDNGIEIQLLHLGKVCSTLSHVSSLTINYCLI